MNTRGKVIVFIGPPGSGKGTQAARVSTALGIPAISTGEMLRRECQSGSNLGKAVQNVLASGALVGDELMNEVVAKRLAQADCEQGCILDGYPRTISQARFLDRLVSKLKLSRPVVFDFDIDCEEVVARLSRRRQCSECGRIFSINGDSEIVCDRDGSKLVQRPDDNPATIRERLKLYERNAGELLRHYAKKEYHRLCAMRTPEQVSDEVLSILGRRAQAAATGSRAKLPVRPRYRVQPA